jgi:hypothetical protein
LLPFAWIFLIAAVVLQERLPGTRQYWLTRPIGWRRLLAAKLLFVAVFVNAVWFLSDCVILFSLRVPVHPLILLLRQIPLSVLLFLPAFCLACISSGLGQIAMGLIVAVFAFVIDLLVPTIFHTHIDRSARLSITVIDFGSEFSYWPWVALTAATLLIIILQFTRRATFAARLLFLIPLFGLIPITFLATVDGGFPARPVLARDLTASGENVPSVSFDFESARRPAAVSEDAFNGLQFPIRVQNLPPSLYIEGSGSAAWPTYPTPAFLYSGPTGRWLRVYRPKELPPAPVSVNAIIQLSVFKVEKTEAVKVRPNKNFSPVAGVFCRDDLPQDSSFACWTGPLQRRLIEYRAFLEVDQASLELGDTRAGPFDEGSLPRTFSPIDSWILRPLHRDPAKPLPEPAKEMQVRLLTLSPQGYAGQTLHAEKVDLKQYLVKP